MATARSTTAAARAVKQIRSVGIHSQPSALWETIETIVLLLPQLVHRFRKGLANPRHDLGRSLVVIIGIRDPL